MGGSVSGQHTQERVMADVLDQLQEQEDLIHRLHIQAVRQQLSVKGESLTHDMARTAERRYFPVRESSKLAASSDE